jgi:hypothetical protein
MEAKQLQCTETNNKSALIVNGTLDRVINVTLVEPETAKTNLIRSKTFDVDIPVEKTELFVAGFDLVSSR